MDSRNLKCARLRYRCALGMAPDLGWNAGIDRSRRERDSADLVARGSSGGQRALLAGPAAIGTGCWRNTDYGPTDHALNVAYAGFEFMHLFAALRLPAALAAAALMVFPRALFVLRIRRLHYAATGRWRQAWRYFW